MSRFISDEEMAKLEAQGATKPKFISDEEMAKLEAQQAATPKLMSDEEMAALENKQPQTAEPESSKLGEAQAAVESFYNTLGLKYLPQLQAVGEQAFTPLFNLIHGQDVQADDYLTARDRYISRQQQLEEQNPKATLAGDVAGLIANMLVPGASSVKALAAQAALANPGDKKGELSGLQLQDRATNAALSALIGKGSQVAAKGLERGGDFLMRSAVNMSRPKAGMGTALMDQGVYGTAPKMQEQMFRLKEKAGQELGKVLEGKTVNVSDLAKKTSDKIKGLGVGKLGIIPESRQDELKALTKIYKDLSTSSATPVGYVADDFATLAKPKEQYTSILKDMPAKDLQALKVEFGKEAHTTVGNPSKTEEGKLYKSAMAEARDLLSKAAGPGYDAANAKYTALTRALQGVDSNSKMDNFIKALTYGGLAGGGMAFGGPEGLALGLAGTPLAKASGAYTARGLSKAAPVLGKEASRAYGLFGRNNEGYLPDNTNDQ